MTTMSFLDVVFKISTDLGPSFTNSLRPERDPSRADGIFSRCHIFRDAWDFDIQARSLSSLPHPGSHSRHYKPLRRKCLTSPCRSHTLPLDTSNGFLGPVADLETQELLRKAESQSWVWGRRSGSSRISGDSRERSSLRNSRRSRKRGETSWLQP